MQRYNVLMSITHNVVTPYLRFVFRREWDTLYPHMLWDDNVTSLNNFKTHESPKSLKTASGKSILRTSGNCDEWDFTILCYVLLFSDFGQKLKIAKPSQYDAIDSLRQERNKLSHPNPNTYISENDFLKRYEDILQCLETIGCKDAKTDMDDIVQQMQGNQDVGICVDTSEQCEIQGVKCCPKIKLTFNQFLITYTMIMLGLVIIGSLYGVILSIGPKPITNSNANPTSNTKNTYETNNIFQQSKSKYKVWPTHSFDTSNAALKTLHLNLSQTTYGTADNNILHSSIPFKTKDPDDSYRNMNTSTQTMAFQSTMRSGDTHSLENVPFASHFLQTKLTKPRNSSANTYIHISQNMHFNTAFQKMENSKSSVLGGKIGNANMTFTDTYLLNPTDFYFPNITTQVTVDLSIDKFLQDIIFPSTNLRKFNGENMSSLQVTGPATIGKSIALTIGAMAPKYGYHAAYANLENITSTDNISSVILKSLGVQIHSHRTYSSLKEMLNRVHTNEKVLYILNFSDEVYFTFEQEMDDTISVLKEKFGFVVLVSPLNTLSETKSEQLLNGTCPEIPPKLAHKIAVVSRKVPPLLEIYGHLVCDRFIEPEEILSDNMVKLLNETDPANLTTLFPIFQHLSTLLTSKQKIQLIQNGITKHYTLPLWSLGFLNYNPMKEASRFFEIYFLSSEIEQNLYERYTNKLRLFKGFILSLVCLTFSGTIAVSTAVAFRQTKNRSHYFCMTVTFGCLFTFSLFLLNRLYLGISEAPVPGMILILAAVVLGGQIWKQKESDKIKQKIFLAIINWILFVLYTVIYFFLLDDVMMYLYHININAIYILGTVFLNTFGIIIIALIPIRNWLKQKIHLTLKQFHNFHLACKIERGKMEVNLKLNNFIMMFCLLTYLHTDILFLFINLCPNMSNPTFDLLIFITKQLGFFTSVMNFIVLPIEECVTITKSEQHNWLNHKTAYLPTLISFAVSYLTCSLSLQYTIYSKPSIPMYLIFTIYCSNFGHILNVEQPVQKKDFLYCFLWSILVLLWYHVINFPFLYSTQQARTPFLDLSVFWIFFLLLGFFYLLMKIYRYFRPYDFSYLLERSLCKLDLAFLWYIIWYMATVCERLVLYTVLNLIT